MNECLLFSILRTRTWACCNKCVPNSDSVSEILVLRACPAPVPLMTRAYFLLSLSFRATHGCNDLEAGGSRLLPPPPGLSVAYCWPACHSHWVAFVFRRPRVLAYYCCPPHSVMPAGGTACPLSPCSTALGFHHHLST